jgi:hypothetical protein
MSYGRLEHTDVVVVVEIQKLFTSELDAIIYDDVVGNPKAVDDVGKKEHSLLRPNAGDRTGLDPLGKFVNGNKQVGETASCPFQGSDEVEPPNNERPCDRNGLQGMRREMGLPCIVLAAFAGAY